MRVFSLLLSAMAMTACDSAFGIHAKDELTRGVDDAALPAPGADAAFDARDSHEAPPVDAAVAGARPPARPEASSGGAETSIAFAARRYYFGSVDPATDVPDPTAWRRIGFDVDGVDTTESAALAELPGTCRRAAGSPVGVLVDGDDGRDNNFGGRIIPFASLAAPSPESVEIGAQDGIRGGTPTPLVVVTGLSEGPDDDEVGVALMVTTNTKLAPWEEVTSLPVDGRSLVPGTVEAKLHFERAYMTGHVIVAGGVHEPPPGPLIFPFDRDTRPITINPLGLVLTLELDPAHRRVIRSTLASVVSLADLVRTLTPPAVRWGAISCTPDGQARLFDWMKVFADLRSDRPQFLDAAGETECDAVSVAMELGWHPVRLPELGDVKDFPPGVDDCVY